MGQQQLQDGVLHRWISSQYCVNSLHTSTYFCYVCCSYNNHTYTTVSYITTVYYSLRVRHSNRLSVIKSTDKAFRTWLQNRNANVYFGFCSSRKLSEVHQHGASGQRGYWQSMPDSKLGKANQRPICWEQLEADADLV